MTTNNTTNINVTLVHSLITEQFPQWSDLPIRPVAQSGWDNRTFHLGDEMLVRLPSSAKYEAQVEKEQAWLPKLAPLLPFEIPAPLAMGQPSTNYPWKWSVYRWIEGETLANTPNTDLYKLATDLAKFIHALHQIDIKGGPVAGDHSFHRGGSLTVYDKQARNAIAALKSKIDIQAATEIWESAIATTWTKAPVWVHGDMSTANLLVSDGKLSAIIDFGQLAVGDPACDLILAWSLFNAENREAFFSALALDLDTWKRGRAWALWKFAIVASGLTPWNAFTAENALQIMLEVIKDHKAHC